MAFCQFSQIIVFPLAKLLVFFQNGKFATCSSFNIVCVVINTIYIVDLYCWMETTATSIILVIG